MSVCFQFVYYLEEHYQKFNYTLEFGMKISVILKNLFILNCMISKFIKKIDVCVNLRIKILFPNYYYLLTFLF